MTGPRTAPEDRAPASSTYWRRREAGQCGLCGGEPERGRANCKGCTDEQSARGRDERERCKAMGLCPTCKSPNDGDRAVCSECRADKALHDRLVRKRRIERGICTGCGDSPATSGGEYTTCAGCRAKRAARRARAKGRAA